VRSELLAAVIPAFNPGEGFAARVAVTAQQCDLVVVVDDGSTDEFAADSLPAEVVVIRQRNAGIASALNVGIKAARSHRPGVRWILTVDQDSQLAPGYVDSVVAGFEDAQRGGLPVAASAAERYNDRPAEVRQLNSGYRTALHVAQSGMLFSVEGLESVGLFDESLVIDVVDTEWCLRALRQGKYVVLAEGAVMLHPVGDLRPLRILGRAVRIKGRTRRFSHHSPLRRYYITRNRVLVYRSHLRTAGKWIARDTVAEARTLLLSVLFGPNRSAQLRGFLVGLADGLRGRRGRAPLTVGR
jgi:rhamnosyltransferase